MNNMMWDLFSELLKLGNKFEISALMCQVIKTYEDRVIFMMKLWRSVNYRPSSCGPTKKNSALSEALRFEGNQLYSSSSLTKEKCFEAFKLFSNSISHAAMGSPEQALAFGNRSAVLCRMKKYAECLMDIERALALNYPDVLRSKLYLRKIHCLAALKNSILNDAIAEANSWMDRMSINESNRTKFSDKLNNLIKKVSKEENESHSLKHSIPVIEKPNPEVPCASDAVAIEYNKEYGRHIVAARDIEPGDVLIVEKPYAMLLGPDNYQTHCQYCLEVCWAMIPCHACPHAMYCSEECRNADWKASHDIECQMFPVLNAALFSKIDLMTLRLTILAIRRSGGVKNLQEIVKEVDKQTDMRTKGFSKDGVYESDQYRSVYSLVTNTEKRNGFDVLRRTFDANVILYLLSICPNQNLVPQDEDLFVFVGTLLLRHQEMVPSNGHSYCEESGLTSHERGLVVMPFMSLINHACDSNIDQIPAFGYKIVRALYPIAKGQQILSGYHSCYALSTKTERQKKLLNQYHFFCGCVPCREDWPLYQDLKSYKVLVASSAKRNAIAKALTKFSQYFDIAGQSQLSVDTSDIIKDLLNMIRVLYDNAPLPCLEMTDVVETLKRYYALQGNRFEIPEI